MVANYLLPSHTQVESASPSPWIWPVGLVTALTNEYDREHQLLFWAKVSEGTSCFLSLEIRRHVRSLTTLRPTSPEDHASHNTFQKVCSGLTRFSTPSP